MTIPLFAGSSTNKTWRKNYYRLSLFLFWFVVASLLVLFQLIQGSYACIAGCDDRDSVIPAADRFSPGAPYKIQFRPNARAHFYSGTIEAKWNPNLTSDIGIHNFSRRGYAGTNAFRTYFEAKSIYRQLHALHPKHTVTISAAYYWHEAARRLAGTSGSIIVMDPDAVDALKKVQTLLKDKELDSQVKHTLNNVSVKRATGWLRPPPRSNRGMATCSGGRVGAGGGTVGHGHRGQRLLHHEMDECRQG